MRAQAETLREPIDRIELNITLHIEYCIISMSIDPEALSRILVRLQDSKNDELSSILSALLPKVLPLVNTPSLRDKSMAILTEALKRAKTHGCHLDLRVLEDLIGPSNLPFACNFALAFLDSLDSLNQLTSVNHSSISKVLCAVADHKQHAYQSNILLYFALKHCSLVDYVFCNHPELVTQHDHLKNVLSDYFLDFCIADRSLLSFPTANIIAYGLGDVRKERLLARKKPFPATILSETRMRLLELQFPSLELVLSMVVVCHCDSDSNVSTKADWRVNKLRESGLLECVPHDTFKFLLNLFLGVANIDTGPALLPKRLAFSVPHRASCLRFMLDLISNTKTVCTLQLADLVPVYTILYEERGYSMHKEELDNLLRLLFGLMTKVMISKTFTRDTCNSLMHHLLPLLDSWKMQAPPSTSDTNNIRAACYDLIAALSVDLSFTADANVLAVMMLSLAEVEALGVNSGNLFNALSKIRERMLSEDNSVRIRFDLIQRLRQHTRASCRLAFIQWLDLSDADAQCCIATLSELCDDMDEMVQKTAIFAFKRHVERMTASLDFKNTLHFTMVLIDAFLTSLGSQRLRIKVDSASEGLLMFLQSLWLALNTIYTRMSPDVVQEDASLSSKIINLTNLLGSSLDDNHAVILNSKSLHTYNDERIEERLNNVSSLQDLESGDFEAVELVAGIVELGASLASQSQRDALYETFYDILLQVWTLFPSRIVRGSVASTLSTISVGSASAAYTRVHAVREEYQARAQAVEIVEESLLIRLFNSLAFEAAVLHCLKEPSLVDEYVTSLLLLLDRSIKSTDAGMSVLNVCIIECLGKVGSRSLQRQTNELPAWSIQANEKLSALVKAKDVYVAAAACMALCRLACSDSSRQSFLKTLNVMHSLIKDPKLNSHLVLTAAESYAMTLLISQQQSALHDCAYVGWFKLLSNMQVVGRTALVAACTSIDLLTPSESIVPCAVALHLVFDTAISKSAGPVDFEFIQSSLQFYLLALKADTPLQQDLSCLGICQLYQLCALLDKTNDCSNIPAELLEKHSTLSCYVSSAVAIVLTRETRVAQPIGYNSSSRATRDSASITNSTSTTTTRREDEDNDMDVDELLNAANDASSADMRSLMSGIMRNQRERTQALNQAEENTNFSHPENRYGVYGKICSIAKKVGEYLLLSV
ncbi:hypothetical protein EON65_10455 [archaeon]|nr:MAG: hypothetical protein EON65_10455 [archaeon]